jgi:hypothetical protein
MAEHRILGNGCTVTVPGGATVSDVREITLPSITMEKIDCTGLANTANRQFLAGKLKAPGDMTIKVPIKHLVLTSIGTEGAITIVLPGSAGTYTAYGFCSGHGEAVVAPDGEVVVDVTFAITNNNGGTETCATFGS